MTMGQRSRTSDEDGRLDSARFSRTSDLWNDALRPPPRAAGLRANDSPGFVALNLARDALRPRLAADGDTRQQEVSAVRQRFARNLHERWSVQHHTVGRIESPHGLTRRVDQDRGLEAQPVARA